WADLRLATAYSDAGSDLPLLEACGFPIAVRPDRVLRAAARRGGWPVVAH
ncbi:MAG: family hydrolase, partial [Actinomycetia bacterium]|nr:family hydrolase [Actinomycetes bacterium]